MTPVLIRKVSRAKWGYSNGLDSSRIPSDAMHDIRTTRNRLSFWSASIESEQAIRQAILCMVATCERVDSMQFVLIDQASVSEISRLVESPGATPAESLAHLHRDLDDLDHRSLGLVAECLHASMLDEKRVRLFTRVDVRSLIAEGLKQGLIQREKLKEQLRNEFAEQ